MGRWTPGYSDDVLASKFKNMVSGAIKRSRLEAEPTISYEAFVEELDEGDSFTATLVEVLVKEVAERRARHCAADRRLITDRTAKNLRLLASPNRIYRERASTRPRSRLNISENVVFPDDWDSHERRSERVDDDDIDDVLSEDYIGMEGARIDSHLYDVYRPYNFASTARRSLPFIPSPRTADDNDTNGPIYDLSVDIHQPLRSHSPPSLLSHFPLTSPPEGTSGGAAPLTRSANATSLTRQPSIRRPTRSRTSDFNEFSSRRRSTYRQNTVQVPESATLYSSNGISSRSAVRRSPVGDELLSSTLDNSSTSGTVLTHRVASLFDSADEVTERAPSPTSRGVPEIRRSWSSTDPIGRPSSLYSLSRNLRGSGTILDRHLPTPRLRRGGLRPPESLLQRHTSPPASPESAPLLRPTTFSGVFIPPEGDEAERELQTPSEDFVQWITFTEHPEAEVSNTIPIQEEPPTSLPTLRSVSPSSEQVEREVVLERV